MNPNLAPNFGDAKFAPFASCIRANGIKDFKEFA